MNYATFFKNKKILICGGTGSIGSEITRQLMKYHPKQIRVYARDETKHQELISELNYPQNLRSFIGDVRDRDRLIKAAEGADIIFNAAALKAVEFCEYNPFETVLTNVIGTQNVIDAALFHNVKKVITISTDKAAQATNTLGASKLLSERLTAAVDYYKGGKKTVFAAVRFGNVLGSRNSLLPRIYEQLHDKKTVTVTDPDMTRFVMSIPSAIELVLYASTIMQGGEVFILKMPSVKIGDLINVYIKELISHKKIEGDSVKIKYIGLRAGEKRHETLLSIDESYHAFENDKVYVILSTMSKPNENVTKKPIRGFRKVPTKDYSSDTAKLLTRQEISEMIRNTKLV